MKIDDALVERLIELAQGAAHLDVDPSATKKGIAVEARAILKVLPKPVDPEKEECRKVIAELRGDSWHGLSDYDSEWHGTYFAAIALAAFRAGRQFERESG